MVESKKSEPNLYRNFAIALTVTILGNPIVLYSVTKNLLFSLLIFLGVGITSLVLFSKPVLKYLQLLFLNLLFIFSLLLHAELLFNTVFPEYIIEDLYRFESNFYFNKPYLNKVFEDKEYSVNYVTNSQGFRIGEEDNPELSVEKVDWLFLGDSYTQGAQVQFEELYTRQLEHYFPEKIILNAGISGFGIPDEYFFYAKEGVNYSPKKVFLQVCNFNDFMLVEKREAKFIDYLMQYSNFARFLLYGFRYANPAELPLGRWTEPFYPAEEENERLNVFHTSSSEQKAKDLTQFKHYLSRLSKEVKDSGAELVIVQIPTKEQTYFHFFQEVVDGFRLDVKKLDMDYPDRLLSSWCEELGLEYISMLEAFQRSEVPVFFDFDEHLTPAGHTVMAEHIASKLSGIEKPRISKISVDNLWDRYPSPSTDYKVFTYQSLRDGNMELFITDSAFQTRRRLTFNSVDEIHPMVASRRNLLTYTEGNQETGKTNVVLQDLTLGTREYVTIGESAHGAIPFFSKDERYLAFASWFQHAKTNNQSNPVIRVLNLENGNQHQLTEDNYESWRPVFSPNGEKVYYISKRESEIFKVYENSVKGGEEKLLIDMGYDIWDPTISPDGRYLAFSARAKANWDLFLYRFADQSILQLTETIRDEWDPVFSADGRELYFAAESGLTNGIYKLQLREE
ncbi:Tol biopolymer transport system component [Algoriphagus sp. 4150]|uniref:hypothetical protein n=1 Tax=Algoriphagus sp. 4150 TaxID=2817756 RepID=UPI00286261F6|nr:hypothetical protein [Algoriphagus sp. 4150]MDR7128021.1 Tol biopolymer transport system component [Algoriphagus sp. 4150]